MLSRLAYVHAADDDDVDLYVDILPALLSDLLLGCGSGPGSFFFRIMCPSPLFLQAAHRLPHRNLVARFPSRDVAQ